MLSGAVDSNKDPLEVTYKYGLSSYAEKFKVIALVLKNCSWPSNIIKQSLIEGRKGQDIRKEIGFVHT